MDYSVILPFAFAFSIFLMGFVFAGDNNEASDARFKEIAKSKELAIKRKLDPDQERRKKMMGNLKDLELKGSDLRLPAPENHYLDFINSMRTRSKPICDIEIGHRTATVCNIGNIAYQLRRPLEWNPKKELFKKDTAQFSLTRAS